MKCPFNEKVICDYVVVENTTSYHCDDCAYYDPRKNIDIDPFNGRSTIGCIIITVVLIIGFIAFVVWIIHSLRPITP